MSNNDHSLLNFLKTNSLFNQSPTKNGLRQSKSRSKDKSNSKNTPTKNRNTFEEEDYRRGNKLFAPNFEANFNSQQEAYRQPEPYRQQESLRPQEPFRQQETYKQPETFKPVDNYKPYNPPQNNNYSYGSSNPPLFNSGEGRFGTFQPLEQKRDTKLYAPLSDPKPVLHQSPPQQQLSQPQGNLSYGSTPNFTSFEAARIETFTVLQHLNQKVKGEIATLNNKLDTFNNKMYRTITSEFKSLRERVLQIFDDAFKESERYIREYMKNQEEMLTGDLYKMRDILTAESAKLETMKSEIEKPGWRKMTGEIISNEHERRIDELVKQSAQLNVGRWELGDLVGYRLKDLEKDLRSIVRLRRDT